MTSEDVIERRLSQARNELREIWDYRYALINDVLDHAVGEMKAIVLSERGAGDGAAELAASCRTDVASERLRGVLQAFGPGLSEVRPGREALGEAHLPAVESKARGDV